MSSTLLWERMEERIARKVRRFAGVAGVAVKDLTGGQTLSINGDEVFPTASTIKIHVLTQLLARAERGELDLDQPMRITPEMHVPGSGVLASMERDVELTVLDVAVLMIIVSDNTATNLCIDMAGIDDTNALLRDLGLTETTLRRKMQDRAAIARSDENVATPAECVAMLEHLQAGRPSPWVAEQCLSIIKKSKASPLSQAIPAGIPLANKPGGMDRVRCDAGIVYLPNRPYAIAVMTKFALGNVQQQDRFIVDVASTVHKTMTALDNDQRLRPGRAREPIGDATRRPAPAMPSAPA